MLYLFKVPTETGYKCSPSVQQKHTRSQLLVHPIHCTALHYLVVLQKKTQKMHHVLWPQEILSVIYSFVDNKTLFTSVSLVNKFANQCASSSIKFLRLDEPSCDFLQHFKNLERVECFSLSGDFTCSNCLPHLKSVLQLTAFDYAPQFMVFKIDDILPFSLEFEHILLSPASFASPLYDISRIAPLAHIKVQDGDWNKECLQEFKKIIHKSSKTLKKLEISHNFDWCNEVIKIVLDESVTNLQEICMYGVNCDCDLQAQLFSKNPNLRVYNHCTGTMSVNMAKALMLHCPNMQNISLNDGSCENGAVPFLAQLPNLKTIDMIYCNCSNDDFATLCSKETCKAQFTEYYSNNSNITLQELREFCKCHNQTLTVLVYNAKHTLDEFKEFIADVMPVNIKRFDNWSHSIPEKDLTYFADTFPTLKNINAAGNNEYEEYNECCGDHGMFDLKIWKELYYGKKWQRFIEMASDDEEGVEMPY